MKITDFALIFIGVTLPIIIIVYINVSFVIKAEEQEMYYKKIINQAVQDATKEMKEVENKDAEIDYGYSGTENKKISVNAQIAVDTFFKSLYKNFGIDGNDAAQRYLQLFVPAVAIIDYNGVQVSSIQTYNKDGNSVTEHRLRPKRYYSYSYTVLDVPGNISDGLKLTDNPKSIHSVEFTMDDYITHRGSEFIAGKWQDNPVKSFYITDGNNNSVLGGTTAVTNLQNKRKEVIANTVTEEIAYAVNANNSYARAAGIAYSFVFPTTTQEEMYSSIEHVGMMAFVQGLTIGNKYLNTKAYSVSKLELSTKYFLTIPAYISKYQMNLYHKDKNCPEYRVSIHSNITPEYVDTKQQAASAKASIKNYGGGYTRIEGFYPCPICNP